MCSRPIVVIVVVFLVFICNSYLFLEAHPRSDRMRSNCSAVICSSLCERCRTLKLTKGMCLTLIRRKSNKEQSCFHHVWRTQLDAQGIFVFLRRSREFEVIVKRGLINQFMVLMHHVLLQAVASSVQKLILLLIIFFLACFVLKISKQDQFTWEA